MTVTDLAQPVIDGVIIRRQPQGAAHQLHRQPCAREWTCDECQGLLAARLAREQIGEDGAGVGRLLASQIVQRSILRALQPAFRVPLGFAMANVVDCRHIRYRVSCSSWPGSSRPSTSFFSSNQRKTWMPGIADKFTQSAQARLLWPGMTKSVSLSPAKCQSLPAA